MREPKKEVIKHSAAIQISSHITLLQRRTWNVLLANAYDELSTEEKHQIRIAHLMRVLEFDSKNEGYLKESLRALVGCTVEWNILDKDGEHEWGIAALLAGARIVRGVCTYTYEPMLRERLHNPSMYARVSLSMQNRFESKHAQALWEICVDYLGNGREYGETPYIPVDELRKLLGQAKTQYTQEFKIFHRFSLKPAIAEINRVSDFCVSVDYQRQGRKVTAIKFKIRRVVRLPEAVSGQRSLFPELEDMPLVVKELKDAGMSSQDAWDIWQQGFTFVDEAARPTELGEDADAAFGRYVREKIHLLRRRQALGKVEHSTGFLLKAIRGNYSNPEYEQEQKREAAVVAQKARKKRAQQVKELETRKAGIEKARDKALDDMYGQMAMESPEVLEAALAEIRAENFIFRQFYKPDRTALENYQASPMLQMGFIPYLERHAPERFEAVKQDYAAQLADVDAQIATLG
jgi:hypothetical protein